MKKINYAVTLVLLFCGLLLHAQQSTTGVVLDAAGVPIPGATIIISGTTQGTTSDFDGNFSIQTNDGDSLEISSIGFESQTIAVNGQTNLRISLHDAVSELDEIIFTGYSAQTRGSVSGAVARKAVRFERRLELAMEGHRSFDLRRWGNAEQIINTYIAKEAETIITFGKGQVYQAKHNVFPISLSAFDGSGGIIKQNTGY